MKLYHQSLLGLLALSVCVHTCCCGGGTHVCVCLNNFVHAVQGTKYTYYIGKSGSSKESQISSFSWMSWSQHLRQATKTFVLFCFVLGFFFLLIIKNFCHSPIVSCFMSSPGHLTPHPHIFFWHRVPPLNSRVPDTRSLHRRSTLAPDPLLIIPSSSLLFEFFFASYTFLVFPPLLMKLLLNRMTKTLFIPSCPRISRYFRSFSLRETRERRSYSLSESHSVDSSLPVDNIFTHFVN